MFAFARACSSGTASGRLCRQLEQILDCSAGAEAVMVGLELENRVSAILSRKRFCSGSQQN